MILRSAEREKMSDDEYAKYLEPSEEIIKIHVYDILHEFLAYHLATSYEYDVLWDDSKLEYEFKDALEYFCAYPQFKEINKEKVLKILKEKYSYEIVNENPLDMKKIQQ